MLNAILMIFIFTLGYFAGKNTNDNVSYEKINQMPRHLRKIIKNYSKFLKRTYSLEKVELLLKNEKASNLFVYSDDKYIYKQLFIASPEHFNYFKKNICKDSHFFISSEQGYMNLDSSKIYSIIFKYTKEPLIHIINKLNYLINDTSDENYKYILGEILDYVKSNNIDITTYDISDANKISKNKENLLEKIYYTEEVLNFGKNEFLLDIIDLLELK